MPGIKAKTKGVKKVTKSTTKSRLNSLLLVIMLIFLTKLMAVSPAGAAEPEIDQMNVSVMSEYDDPRVLAIFEPTLTENTKVPLKIRFYIPKSATKIQVGMACEIPEGQGHRCKIYDLKEVAGDNFNELTYQVDTAKNLFFEYYWDPFEGKTTGDKQFVFEFKAPYSIKTLNFQIREPVKGVKDFKVEPASNSVSTDQEGAKIHTYTFNNVAAGQVFTFKANYNKAEAGVDKPKQTGDIQNGNLPVGATASSNPGTVRVFIFLVVVLLTIGGLAFYWRTQQATQEAVSMAGSGQVKAAKAKAAKPKAKASGSQGKKVRYCSHCGSELIAKAKFCSECGEQV